MQHSKIKEGWILYFNTRICDIHLSVPCTRPANVSVGYPTTHKALVFLYVHNSTLCFNRPIFRRSKFALYFWNGNKGASLHACGDNYKMEATWCTLLDSRFNWYECLWQGCPNFLPGGATCGEMNICGGRPFRPIKKYNNNGNNSNDSNNNTCKKVYECLVFIGMFQFGVIFSTCFFSISVNVFSKWHLSAKMRTFLLIIFI